MRRISATILVPYIIAIAACGGCSDDTGDTGNAYIVSNDLVFERTEGTFVDFKTELSIWCGPWEKGEVPVNTLHIRAGGPQGGRNNYWSLRAVVDDIVLGEKMHFPSDFIWNEPEGAELFVYDEPNELSSLEEESHGWIMFEELDCVPPGIVEFSIDAVLGSEYHDGDSLKVYGTFRARFMP